MAEITVTSANLNLEKIRSRSRRSYGEAVRTKPTRRESEAQRILDPERIASCITLHLFVEYGGKYTRGSRFQLVIALDKLGVINARVVRDSAVRLGVIANSLDELIQARRLLSREDLTKGQLADTIWLSDDERYACERTLQEMEDKREARRQRRRASSPDEL